jgi:hypothetical protein
VFTFLHPGGVGNEPPPYEGIADDANKWIFVHFAQLVLTPFVAVGVWLLLDGIQSAAATIARASLVVWMVFFSAGQLSWVVLVLAATVALWRASASRLIVGATLLSFLFATHAGYMAAVGLIALFVAELLTFRGRHAQPAPAMHPA